MQDKPDVLASKFEEVVKEFGLDACVKVIDEIKKKRLEHNLHVKLYPLVIDALNQNTDLVKLATINAKARQKLIALEEAKKKVLEELDDA